MRNLRDVKLETLSDSDFRDLVDRELRKDHPSVSASDRQELNAVSPKLRHPEVINRWIGVLEIMKASSETQLGAKRSDLRRVHGTVTDEEYQSRRRAFESWRAGNVRFLHSVNTRLMEARSLKSQQFGTTFPDRLIEERNQTSEAWLALKRAIRDHRATVLAEYDPTDADTALWAVIADQENAVA